MSMKYAHETSTKPKGLTVWYGNLSLRPLSVDETLSRMQGGLSLLLAFDTENFGRLLFDVPARVTGDPANDRLIDVAPMSRFAVLADALVYIRSIRLSIMRNGEYVQPLMLNGEKAIMGIALAAGARVIIEPPQQQRYELTTHRMVLEMPNA